MLSALTETGTLVYAHQVIKADGPFTCPECHTPVIVRRPTERIDHFAHKARTSDCTMGGESLDHMELKFQIYDDCIALGYKAALEHQIGERRTDVAVWVGDTAYAVEVQLSPQCFDELLDRTDNHTTCGFTTLWVGILPAGPLSSLNAYAQYKVRSFQKEIHALQGGQFFQYRGKGYFDVVHFMGFRYETFKQYKVLFQPVHIRDMIERSTEYGCTASVREEKRWWTKPKPTSSRQSY
jgi:competence protein CoiA